MKIKHIKHYDNYNEALRQWRINTPSILHSHTDGTYIVEWETICNSTPDLMREYLLGIKLQYELSQEQLDALAYADSAIKTLQDMEIIK